VTHGLWSYREGPGVFKLLLSPFRRPGPLPTKDHLAVCQFLAFQMVRGPRKRRTIQLEAPYALKIQAGDALIERDLREITAVPHPNVHVGSTDLARAAVAGYSLSYGDDWLLVPVRLPAGVLARVTRVTVRDTYGNRRAIRSCAELDGPGRNWRYFELSGDSSADAADLHDRRCPWLFLAPRAGRVGRVQAG
jgi:hypothetical protein